MSEREFSEMTFDDQDEDGWEIATDWLNDDGSWKDVWMFSRCQLAPVNHGLIFKVSSEGCQRDFNIANFNIPVVSQTLGELLSVMAPNCIQRIPITFEDKIASAHQWEALNVLQLIDCINYRDSNIDYYPSESSDPWAKANPTKAGLPRGVRCLRINQEKCYGKGVFRIKNWEVPMIVSRAIKDAIEANGMKGVRFLAV